MGEENLIVTYTFVSLKILSKNKYERIPNCLYATEINQTVAITYEQRFG